MVNKYKLAYGLPIAYAHLTLPILKVKVKVMHISTVDISQTATDKANTAIGNKQKVACGLSIGRFTI